MEAIVFRISDSAATVFSARVSPPAKNTPSRLVSAPQLENTLYANPESLRTRWMSRELNPLPPPSRKSVTCAAK